MPTAGPHQLAAASTRVNVLVMAPPGCGKTELLALRAEALIPRLLPNQKILALTFTNRAQANLTERLRKSLGVSRFRRYVTVRNFHGHAAEILLAHGATLGLRPEDLSLPTSKAMRKALQQFSSDSASNSAAAKLLAATKRAPLSDSQVIEALGDAGDALAKRVELERIGNNQLHYEDLLRHAQRLLRVAEVANLYHQHYGAVLVDEFQDLSLQQLDIALRSCTASRTFAGDPLQGIFSWAGAAPEQVESKLRALCGAPTQLTVSYRSSPAVLSLLNSVSSRMGAAPLHAYDPSAWNEGGVAAAFALKSMPDEAQLIARVTRRIVEADLTASVGVISRSGWRRREIDKVFGRMPTIPCRRWDLAIEDPAILDRLRTAVGAMPRNVGIEEAHQKVVTAVDPSDVDTIEQINHAFQQVAAGMTGTVRAALDQFRTRNDDASVGAGVHLLNAHTGKGQQFDWVFIPGFEEKHLPDKRSTDGEALAEEERVLLVMLSRAKHGVVVTTATRLDGMYGPYDSVRSRWWADLVASTTMGRSALKAHLAKYYRLV